MANFGPGVPEWVGYALGLRSGLYQPARSWSRCVLSLHEVGVGRRASMLVQAEQGLEKRFWVAPFLLLLQAFCWALGFRGYSWLVLGLRD